MCMTKISCHFLDLTIKTDDFLARGMHMHVHSHECNTISKKIASDVLFCKERIQLAFSPLLSSSKSVSVPDRQYIHRSCKSANSMDDLSIEAKASRTLNGTWHGPTICPQQSVESIFPHPAPKSYPKASTKPKDQRPHKRSQPRQQPTNA